MEAPVAIIIAVGIVLTPLVVVGIANTYYGVRYRLPFAFSGTNAIQTMLDFGNVRTGMTILDLGSGAGDILLAAARRGAHAHGLEINIFLVWLTRFRARRARLSHLITVERADIFCTPLPHADVVVLYLPSKKTFELQKRLVTELPSNALIISNGLSFPGWTPEKSAHGVFVYRVSSSKKIT